MMADGDSGYRCTVLICDDRLEMRNAIVRVLADARKFNVIGQACDGSSCLELVRAVDADVLILDIGMPGGGPHVASAVKELKPGLHILVFSGINDVAMRQDMLSAGADDYVVKTGRLRPLLEALNRAFDQRHPVDAR